VHAAVTYEATLELVVRSDFAACVRRIANATEDVQQARNDAAVRKAEFLDVGSTDPAGAQAAFQAGDRAFFAAAKQAILPRLDLVTHYVNS